MGHLKDLKYLSINKNRKYVCRLKYIVLFLLIVLFGFVNNEKCKNI